MVWGLACLINSHAGPRACDKAINTSSHATFKCSKTLRCENFEVWRINVTEMYGEFATCNIREQLFKCCALFRLSYYLMCITSFLLLSFLVSLCASHSHTGGRGHVSKYRYSSSAHNLNRAAYSQGKEAFGIFWDFMARKDTVRIERRWFSLYYKIIFNVLSSFSHLHMGLLVSVGIHTPGGWQLPSKQRQSNPNQLL